MFPWGRESIHLVIVGDDGTTLDSTISESATSHVTTETIPPTDTPTTEPVDGFVIDARHCPNQGLDALEHRRDTHPNRPLILVTPPDADTLTPTALDQGATDTIPATVADTDPTLFVDRLTTIVERVATHTGFADLYDSIAGTISIHDPDTGAMLHANQTLADLTGLDHDTLLTKTVGDITADLPGYDLDRARQIVQTVADQDAPIQLDWPLQRTDGGVRWLEAKLTPITVAGQQYVLSASTEITERRRKEREYEQIFDGVNDSITVHDPWNETLLDVNDSLCELTGYSRDTILDMGLDGFSVTDEGYTAERAYDIQQRVAASGNPETVDWKIETANGDHRTLEVVLSPASIGGEDRVLVLSRDVTERDQLEETYQELFDGVGDGLVVHDPDTGEILDVNPRYCELTRYDREELVGANIDLIVPDDAAFTFEDAINRIEATREEGPQLFEFKGQRKDDTTFMGEIHLDTVTIQGDERVLASVRDITGRKRRERAIRDLQDATEQIQDDDTIEAVLDTAVETAATTLELPVTAAWTHADDRLEPVTATNPVYDHDLLSTLETDRFEYQAYRDGDVTTYDPSAENPDNPLETAILLPLGDHGLIAAGRPDQTEYDDVTLDVARTLAEHVTTALDRIERERQVRESERRLSLIADRIDEVIFLAAPDFSEAYYVNDAYEDLWGHPVDDLYDDPRNFMDSIDERDEATFQTEFEAMLDDIEDGDPDDSYEFEYRLRRPDDEIRWVRATGYPVVEDVSDPRFVGIVEDVTERRELESTYRNVFENVSDGLVVHDPDTGEILDVNDRFCSMNGYDRDELIGETIDAVTAPDHAYEQAQERIQTAKDGESVLFEWRNQRSDGETFPVEVHLRVVELRGERRVLGSVRDITERKRREQEYEQIYNNVNASIVVQHPETAEVLDANQAFLDRLGYDTVETVRERGFEALSASSEGFTLERAQQLCRQVMESGEPETVEWQQVTKDGDRRWIEAKVTPAEIQGEDRILSMQRDVTEQRRTERRLRAILNRIDEAIYLGWVHDSRHPTRAPEYVSNGYEEIWGQPLETILDEYDEGFVDTIHPDDVATYRQSMKQIMADVDADEADDRYSLEYRIQRPDGEMRWVETDYYPLDWEDGPPRIITVSRDITDRKQREQRLASFDEATEDLTTADTPIEAASHAVDAGTDTLELDAVDVFLYDEDDGVLTAEVTADTLPETDTTIGPGDGVLWEGFATGSIVDADHYDGDHPITGTDAETSVADWRQLPVGNHGVLLVGSHDRSLTSEIVDSAHVLAATLEAALNHVQSQEAIASREEALRTETERAERLDRLARLTQQVEAAITDASDPTTVEHAVCDRLVEADPYEVAWIGGVEVGTDQLKPRTVVGKSASDIATLDLKTTTDDADRHPAVGAWQTDSVEVTNSIVGDGPSRQWREQVLAAGYQSLCAVPLTYDGITYGVLTIAAAAPNAFDDRVQTVLSQLGTSIAHALAGIERRRALESDATVELEFQGDGTELPFAEVAMRLECPVRHERTVHRKDGDVSVYYAIDGDTPPDAESVIEDVVGGTVDVVRDEPTELLVEAVTDSWFGAPLAEYGAVLRRAEATVETTTLTVELPAQADLRSFTDRLEELAPTLEMEAKRQHKEGGQSVPELRNRIESRLTDRQHEAVRTAFAAGYFEWPRQSDGSDVADRLDITQPTFNKHLRLAEQKTFEAIFDADA